MPFFNWQEIKKGTGLLAVDNQQNGAFIWTDVERLSEKHRIRAEKGGVSC